MLKPVAPLMFDETTGKPVVMQHALSFDFIPRIEPNYNRKKMANGGVLPPLNQDLTEEDEDLTELERITARVKTLESQQRRNVNQPIDDEFEGSDAQNEGVDAGIGTLDSMMEGIAGLIGGIGNLGIAGAVQGMIGMHQQQEEIDTSVAASTVDDPVDVTGHDPSQTGITGLIGMHDVSEAQIQAQIDAATAQSQQEEAQAQAAQAAADTAQTMSESEAEQVEADATAAAAEAGATGMAEASGEDDGFADTEGIAASGGLIRGYQEGAMVEGQADTTMDTAGLGPMGLVDDMAGDQVTGVEDDLNMEVEEGAYVLNADTVELVGLKDLNQLTKDAIDIAIESDIPLPKSVDPTQKVPIKISNGEFVIPAILVPIIGLENLEKMNKRGLEYREKNTEEAPPQEAQQQDVPVEPSEVPSRGVPGEINLAQGGALADQMNQLM
jgi:hypothetical protein